MRTLKNIELKLALELAPYDFTEKDSPEGNYDSEKFFLYWRNALAESGISELEAIKKAWYFVELQNIQNEDLNIILQTHLKNNENEDLEDLPPLSGGVVLLNQEEVIISPTCCTDISDYVNWLGIEENENLEQLWIGHPWVFFQTIGTEIIFSDFVEKNAEFLIPEDMKFSINFKELKREISKLEREMNVFFNRVQNCLNNLGYGNVEEMANQLINNGRE